jgi:hypothetical protein
LQKRNLTIGSREIFAALNVARTSASRIGVINQQSPVFCIPTSNSRRVRFFRQSIVTSQKPRLQQEWI